MAVDIGVLCARVRVEEKQILAALGNDRAESVDPTEHPLPPGPATDSGENAQGATHAVLIDRMTNRTVAAAVHALYAHRGGKVLGAGLAATGSRLDVITALTHAGVPRPATMVGFTESTGIAAAEQVGYPCTVLPMTQGARTTSVPDADTADAVIEHRVVLGSDHDALVVVQRGAPVGDAVTRVHVVDGNAVASDREDSDARTIRLAQRAADVLNASIVSIDIAVIDGDHVVWDVHPVADFRGHHQIGELSMADAIAQLATRRVPLQTQEDDHVFAITA